MWLVWAPYLITSVYVHTDGLSLDLTLMPGAWVGDHVVVVGPRPLGLGPSVLGAWPWALWFPGARPVLALGLLAWALVLGYVSAGASFAVWRRVLLSAHAACKPSICVLMLSLEPRVCIAYAGFCS